MITHPRLKTLCHYLDGELHERKARSVAAHLARCPHCRQRIEPLTALEATFSGDDGISDELTGRLMSNLPLAKWNATPTIATIEAISGGCQVTAEGDPSPIEAFKGLGLRPADRLRVDPSGLVQIQLDDGSLLWLNGNASATLLNSQSSLRLASGEIFAQMKPQTSPFTVQTPTARLTVLGTTFEAGVTAWESTFLRVLKGSVAFNNATGECLVGPRQEVDATASQQPAAQKIRELAEVGRWVCTPLPGDDLFTDPRPERTPLRVPATIVGGIVLILLVLAMGWSMLIHSNLTMQTATEQWQPPAQTTIDDHRTLTLTGIRWPVGHRFIHRFELNITTGDTTTKANSPRQFLKQSQDIVLEVIGRQASGTRQVTMRFRDIRFEIEQEGQHIVIDNRSSQTDLSEHPFSVILRAQQTAHFDVRVSPEGKILSFEGFESFRREVLSQIDSTLVGVLDAFLHEEFYRRMFALSLIQSPQQSGNDGRKWQALAPFGANAQDSGEMKAQYMFEGWDLFNGHQCALMNVAQEELRTDAETSGGHGQVWYDPQLGMIIKTVWLLERPTQQIDTETPPETISQYLLCRLMAVEPLQPAQTEAGQ